MKFDRVLKLLVILALSVGLAAALVGFASAVSINLQTVPDESTPVPPPPPGFTNPYSEQNSALLEETLTPKPGRGVWLYRNVDGVPVDSSNNGETLAFPSAYHWTPDSPSVINILIYADDYVHPAPNTYLDQALQALGLGYTAHYDSDYAGFETSLTSGSWDLVIMAADSFSSPPSVHDALNTYAVGGGKLILHDWNVGSNPGHPLWATLGISYTSSISDPPVPIFWWDYGHPIFNNPESVPPPINPISGTFGIYGQRVELLPGFQALGGYTPSPAPNEAALILADKNLTIFRGFLDGQYESDLDGDSQMDTVELWINLISRLTAPTQYVATSWNNTAVHLLDFGLNNQGSFPAGAPAPNAVATDGDLIFSGHLGTQEIVAYDFDGVEQFRWSAPFPGGLRGMDFVNGELAINNGSTIDFYEPLSGTFLRSIPTLGALIEGIAYDGVLLWELDTTAIFGADPIDGSFVISITNAAGGCPFGGTGITANSLNLLTLGCVNGDWFQVSSADGSVLRSGNNSIDMYGLKTLPSADIAVTITESADPVLAGEQLAYTVTIENHGVTTASNILLTDTLPAGVTLVSITPGAPTCTEAGGEVICNLAEVAAGTAAEIVILVEAPTTTGALLSTAQVQADEIDPVPLNNSATVQTLVATDFLPHTCDVPGNPFLNCSFETGNFFFWGTETLTDTFYTFTVGGPGLSSWMGFFMSAPTDGGFAALHGFDGNGPGLIRIFQDIHLPLGSHNLVFDYRAAWDLITFAPPGTIGRSFNIHVEPLFGGPPLQTTPILFAPPFTWVDDTGDMTGIVDVSAYAGSSVRLTFEWVVPQNFTGPAWFQLDNVQVTLEPPDIMVSPPALSSEAFPHLVDVQVLTIENTGLTALNWGFVENPLSALALFARPPAVFGPTPDAGYLGQPAGGSLSSWQVGDHFDPVINGKRPIKQMPVAPAQVDAFSFYTDRVAFDAAYPGLPLEDFETGQVITASLTSCASPLEYRVTNQCFGAGDLLPGFSLGDLPPGPTEAFATYLNQYVVLGANYIGLPTTSKVVGPNYYVDDIDLAFQYYDVFEVGFDLHAGFPLTDTDTLDITIYGPGGAISTVVTATTNITGTFWGVVSDEPISRLIISSPGGRAELIDNLVFTASPCDPVTWAQVDPITGTLPAGSNLPVDVTFNPTGLATGTYTGNLCLLSNDLEEPLVAVPVTFTVKVPVYLPMITRNGP